jgi:hypothetical protein
MRKLWFRRRAVSTMIGGIIVLSLFLVGLVAMMLVSQQYDIYQSLSGRMQVKNNDRFSEQLEPVDPGIVPGYPSGTPNCPGGFPCNSNTMIVSSRSIPSEIARIYINSTSGPCAGLCVLDPAATPKAYAFRASDALINSGEFFHYIEFWLPSTVQLPTSCIVSGLTVDFGCNSVTIVTTRGNIVAFQYPFPPAGPGQSSAAQGGTGIYIGPIVYTYQKGLISYSTHSKPTPNFPLFGTNGRWKMPDNDYIVIYVKLEQDVCKQSSYSNCKDAYLTAQSILELFRFDTPGQVNEFYIIAPITLQLCEWFRQHDPMKPTTNIVCSPSYGYADTNSTGNNGDPGNNGRNIIPYTPCNTSPANYNLCTTPTKRYMIPAPTQTQWQNKERGTPVIVAFSMSASTVCPYTGNCNAVAGKISSWGGNSVTTFLGLSYVWDDSSGGGSYTYGVTLPFVAMCIYDAIDPDCPG